MGVPVIIKHMYNAEDVANGYAQVMENTDTIYNQTFYNDALTHGVGIASTGTSSFEWFDPTGNIVTGTVSPGPGYTAAPMYRGYGPGYLCYAILPDVPEDVFKLTPQGTLLRIQSARVNLPWYPQAGDNDLLIIAEIDPWERVIATHERFQLKQVSPISIHGADRLGRREYSLPPAGGNRLWVGQVCEMSRVPETDSNIYTVEVDR
jgi:hypothetical protein